MDHVINHQLKTVNTGKFTIHFFNSLTNIKIILLTEPDLVDVEPKLM